MNHFKKLNLSQEAIESLEEKIDKLPKAKVDKDRICSCGRCDGYGNVFIADATGQMRARFCRNLSNEMAVSFQDEQMQEIGFEDWPVPEWDLFKEMDRYVETDSVRAIGQLIEDVKGKKEPRAVILCGDNGRSKTFSSLVAIKELTNSGFKCHADKFPQLIEARKQGINGYYRSKSFEGKLRDCDLILIDEVGREHSGKNIDHAQAILDTVADLTYKKRFVIITSNLSLVELNKYFSSSFKSRIAGSGSTIIEEKNDYDLRLEGF